MAKLVNKNITLNGRRTSIRLEQDMWAALHEICDREGISISMLCSRIANKRKSGTLTAAVRIFVVAYYRCAATEDGHARVGHGRIAEPRLCAVV